MDFTRFQDKRICVAVSGGIDSVSLLDYMQKRQKEFGYELCVVHCEHGIRDKESVRDMQFVEELCKQYGLELTVFREDCLAKAEREKCSVETSARRFRMQSFARLIKGGKADYIATAHHKNDEAETVLFRLARGTSLTGAQGMAQEKEYILRPFLDWSKADIQRYAQENGLTFCEDSTNAMRDATRNKIRLDVLPLLEDAVPGAVENLVRFAQIAGEDDAYLYRQSERILSKPNHNKYFIFFCKDTPIFYRACVTALKGLGVERDYTRLHLQLLFDLQQKQRGASLCMPQNVRARKTGNGIVLYLKEELPTLVTLPKYYKDGRFDGGRYVVTLYTDETHIPPTDMPILRIDGDKVPKCATFRFRKDGDEIRVFGGRTKTLKKLFNERKIDVEERKYLPLIADEHTIYAVCGVEIADQVKVTEDTKNIVYIAIERI
ncbi:MAG: tRNA lysidine(34) synthetase TilS [Clostridia bacterium]|nr:tRNA lysidine(34) synthetase TilS [Clostridia bacterium]